jgi:hypothetical protein
MSFSTFSGSATEGSCDLEELADQKMWGLLYEVKTEEFDALDIIAGVYREHLKRIMVTVTDKEGKHLTATTYINSRPGGPFHPLETYTKPILVGAKALELPEEYISELEEIIACAQQQQLGG